MSAYTNYYTSSDVNVLVESPRSVDSILLDKLRTIAFSESISASPIYGTNKTRFGFLSKGNLLINGYIELNFIHPLYFKKALNKLSDASDLIIKQDPRDIVFGSDVLDLEKNINEKKIRESIASQSDLPGIDTFPEGFNLRVAFNNGNMYHQDTTKSFLIEYVKITGSQITSSVSMDGNVSMAYQFMARQLS